MKGAKFIVLNRRDIHVMHYLLSSTMTKALDDEIFPGAVLLVSHKGNILFHEPFGVADLDTQDKISQESFFDLASLTKPLATALSIMKLVETGLVSVDMKVCDIIDDFRVSDKSRITIDHLLRHTSGLPSHRPFYQSINCETHGWSFEKGKEVQSMIRRAIVNERLESPPGQFQKYSDLGYMVLCWIVEKVTGRFFDEYVYAKLFEPMEIEELFFVRAPAQKLDLDSSQILGLAFPERLDRGFFVSTEKCPWRKKTVRREVHDDNAWVAGGVDGHAGLFGTAYSVWKLLNLFMSSQRCYDGKNYGRMKCSEFIVKPDVIKSFIAGGSAGKMVAGFDTPSPSGSSSGKYFSKESIGHLGFTGTSFWMDIQNELIVVLLTNRVHPSRKNVKIRQFRPIIHDLIVKNCL